MGSCHALNTYYLYLYICTLVYSSLRKTSQEPFAAFLSEDRARLHSTGMKTVQKLRKICGKTLNQQHRITTMQLQQDAFGRTAKRTFGKSAKRSRGYLCEKS